MARITLKGTECHTVGSLPPVGGGAPEFVLVNGDLADVSLADFSGKRKVLSIVPSLDTSVCAASARAFNQRAASMPDAVILNISADLPFAQKRFCDAEGLDQVVMLSAFRSPGFGEAYGVTIADGPLAGLLSRAIVVLDPENRVVHTEQVPEITQEPDYDAAFAALKG